MPDAHVNFASSEVVTAPSPATSGTTLTVLPGDGAIFPVGTFNAVVLTPTLTSRASPSPADAEIVRVTNIVTDTFTIQRAIEGSPARTIVVGDRIIAGTYQGITAKTLTDIETNMSVNLFWQNSDVGNVSTTETTLFDTTIGAGRLAINNERIEATVGGTVTSFASPNRIWDLYYPSGTHLLTITPATAGFSSWKIDIDAVRTTASAARLLVSWSLGAQSGVTYINLASVDHSVAQHLLVTATGQATNDIISKVAFSRWIPV